MPIDHSSSNTKLAIPALDALKKLLPQSGSWKRTRSLGAVFAASLPAQRLVKKKNQSHFQGVATYSGQAVLTTSVKNGIVIAAYNAGHPTQFFADNTPTHLSPPYSHPGGLQSIGNYVAVPVYKDQKATSGAPATKGTELHIYDQFAAPTPVYKQEITTEQGTPTRAYCLGITNVEIQGAEHYIMAIVTQHRGERIQIYRSSPANASFADADFRFDLVRTWDSGGDADWDGFPDSMSLLADNDGKTYIVGLDTRPRGYKKLIPHIDKLGFGKDWVSLYELDLNATDKQNLIQIMGGFKVKCTRGPAFSMGASIFCSSPTTVRITACEGKALQRVKKINLNIFHAPGDAPTQNS